MNAKHVFFGLLAVLALPASAVDVKGNNRQTVVINGVAANTAVGRGHAVMNIASMKGNQVVRSNSQTVVINGAVVNTAAGGAKSTLEIGGGGGGRQQIAVDGAVVSTGVGMHGNSTVRIGR